MSGAFDELNATDLVLSEPENMEQAILFYGDDLVGLLRWREKNDPESEVDDAEDDAEDDDRAAKFNYDARHLAGEHDQTTHGRGGGGSGLGVFVPGKPRLGAGDEVPFPKALQGI